VLAAHHGGASAVVLVGVPRDLVELLDRGRSAAASTPVTRVVAGGSVVPARVAADLVPRRGWGLPVLCVLLAGALGGVVALDGGHLLEAWRDLGR
jgi:uncharacterized membrane-anchored protein